MKLWMIALFFPFWAAACAHHDEPRNPSSTDATPAFIGKKAPPANRCNP